MLSKSIQDYWENVETMIREVGGLNVVNINGGREKLLGFIRHIVDLYSFLLPILHQDEIENIAFAAGYTCISKILRFLFICIQSHLSRINF